MIPRSARRPSRTQSRNMASTLSLILFAFLALILLCPVAVNADEDKKSEYGTIIGIGRSIPTLCHFQWLIIPLLRFGHHLFLRWVG
jgi:amino acid permease